MTMNFGPLAYLEVHKTGSTFIGDFLEKTSTLECLEKRKHYPVMDDFNPETFYFNSIRHPLAVYLSLYRYAFTFGGVLAKRLFTLGYRHLYDSENPKAFEQWLLFILDPKNAHLLGDEYNQHASRLNIGLLTYRYLHLSFKRPNDVLSKIENNSAIQKIYNQEKIVRFTVRQETMAQDLAVLSQTIVPEYFDQDLVTNYLEANKRLNKSTRNHANYTLTPSAKQRLLEKESFVFANFYSDTIKNMRS